MTLTSPIHWQQDVTSKAYFIYFEWISCDLKKKEGGCDLYICFILKEMFFCNANDSQLKID